jgi:GNAT superfamily N-acetyltransferase
MCRIRQCQASDFDGIILLLQQLWTDKLIRPDSLRSVFDRALLSESNAYLCAAEEGQVVGFGSLSVHDTLWPEGCLGYIDELVVDSTWRGKGIGDRLLEQLINLAREKGCCRIELVSAFYREESRRFYEERGFAARAYVLSKIL